jgi:uncharacterized protein involved in exopolysaccharide biosynthesis
MPDAASNRSLELSQRLYGRLLAAYPLRHRQEYGGAMAQLFRDQCRDAWAAGRTWGLLALWLRTLPDLVKTSVLERFTHLNQWKYMSDKLNALRPGRSPLSVFLSVFLVVFILTLLIATVITFILPESYAATCRIEVESDAQEAGVQTAQSWTYDPYFIQTTFEIIQSQAVLSNVVSELKLKEEWGKRYRQPLTTTDAMELLKRRMELKPVRNTKLIAITVYSDDKKECAVLANAVARAYQDYRNNQRRQLVEAGLRVLQEDAAANETRIRAVTDDLQNLRRNLNVTDNGPNDMNSSPTLTPDMIHTYNEQKIEQERTCKSLATQFDKLQALDRDKLRQVLPTVTPDAVLSDLLGKLTAAEQQYATLTNDYAPGEMHITRVRSMLDTLNAQIDARVAGIMTGLQTDVQSKQAALKALNEAVENARQTDLDDQKRTQPYWEEKKNLAQLQDFQNVLAAKIEAQKLNLELPVTSLVQITDPAQPQDYPVRPNKPLNLLLGAILGLFLGGVAGSIAALITHRLSRRPANIS